MQPDTGSTGVEKGKKENTFILHWGTIRASLGSF